jgi:phospholipid/cholesterol/gamma-HCH transport system permease protein
MPGHYSNSPSGPTRPWSLWRVVDRLGHSALDWLRTFRGILAFTLITLGAALAHGLRTSRTVQPLVRRQVHFAGSRLLPLSTFIAASLGVVVVGQSIILLTRLGAEAYVGTVMVAAVVRELGPLTVAMLVLARVGAAHVIELGTTRALGEVEALEALRIDPIQYLVVPRVLGMAGSVFALTIYFLLVALAAGYLFAFVQDVSFTPAAYVRQISLALVWEDFLLMAVKCLAFGALIATTTCYHGLARPLRLEDLAATTSRALVQGAAACVLVDVGFIAFLHLAAR